MSESELNLKIKVMNITEKKKKKQQQNPQQNSALWEIFLLISTHITL